MGSKGGGTTKQVSEPWGRSQPYLLESMDWAKNIARNPPQFYPGQTFVGPTSGELGAWDTRLGYSDAVFGGANAPKFGQATDTLSRLLEGGLTGGVAGGAAGGASNALARMLSGSPDYAGLEGAIEAANAPILRQLEQEIIPGLNSRATFLNNDTGGVKALNKVLPEIGERMSLNAQTLTNQERMRALDAQERGLGMFGSLAGAASGDQIRALGMFPMIAGLGESPGLLAGQFAEWGKQFPQQALSEDMARWDYNQNMPKDMATWYNSLIHGTAGLGGTSSSKTPQNAGLNALGGAAMGAGLAGSLGMGTGMGAGLGALLAFL